MKIIWSKRAFLNLQREKEYIEQANAQAAKKFVNKIFEALEYLKQFPAIGRAGRVFGTRELVFTDLPYLIPYRVRGEQIQIIRIFHTSRKPPEES